MWRSAVSAWRLGCACTLVVVAGCSEDSARTGPAKVDVNAAGGRAGATAASADNGGHGTSEGTAGAGADNDAEGGATDAGVGGAQSMRSNGGGATVTSSEQGGSSNSDDTSAGAAGENGGTTNGGTTNGGTTNGGTTNGGTTNGGTTSDTGNGANGGAAGGDAGNDAAGGVAGEPNGSAGSDALGGTAGASGSGGAPTVLTLSNLVVEPNPNMTISCFVSWTTDEPANSEVDFGENAYSFRRRDDALVTEHRVLVIGMHADTNYELRAVSNSAERSGSAETQFTTGALPAGIPFPALTQSDFTRSEVGWTLTNIEVGRTTPAKIVMYDEDGEPVWYFIDGTHDDSRGDVSAELYGDSVLVGPAPGEPARKVDLSGAVLWEGPPNDDLSHEQTHGAFQTSSGNVLLNIELDKAAQVGAVEIDNQLLEELTPSLGVAWSWKLFDHITPSGNREELCHGNSLKLDEAANIAYYNCRYLGLFKLDRSTGNVLWRLGGTWDTTSIGPGDFTFEPPSSHFSNAHDPEVHADGSVLLYDNGAVNPLPPPGQTYHSRIVEYQLDETTRTATRTFEFPGDFAVDDWYKNQWYAPIWGDADRLANGNILVTAGMRSPTLSTRIFEVTRDGAVVWELTFPPNNGSFQAQRLSPPPLVEKLP